MYRSVAKPFDDIVRWALVEGSTVMTGSLADGAGEIFHGSSLRHRRPDRVAPAGLESTDDSPGSSAAKDSGKIEPSLRGSGAAISALSMHMCSAAPSGLNRTPVSVRL